MKDNSLTVQVRRRRKYSSYQGEISELAENVINRDFHSRKPNDKVLTDITKFSIPEGKVYFREKVLILIWSKHNKVPD